MKLKFKKKPEQIELIKAMASKKVSEAQKAKEAFAEFITPVAQEYIRQADTASLIYRELQINMDDQPTVPLDPLKDTSEDEWVVWSQRQAGGLPYNEPAGQEEMLVATYPLDSALAIPTETIRRGRIDYVALYIERMLQEVLMKMLHNGWAVLMRAVAEAKTNGSDHIITSNTQDQFSVTDMSELLKQVDDQNQSFSGGTPAGMSAQGLTDAFVSSEIMKQIRNFTVNPLNSRTGPGGSTDIALDDETRREIFNNAGLGELYGVNITRLHEMGVDGAYNTLFSNFASSSIAHSNQDFDSSDDEIVFGADLSQDFAFRVVRTDSEKGNSLMVEPDDQFVRRQKKQGWFVELEEGRAVTEARAMSALIV